MAKTNEEGSLKRVTEVVVNNVPPRSLVDGRLQFSRSDWSLWLLFLCFSVCFQKLTFSKGIAFEQRLTSALIFFQCVYIALSSWLTQEKRKVDGRHYGDYDD